MYLDGEYEVAITSLGKLIEHSPESITVVKEPPPKDFPSMTEQAKGFVRSMTEWAKSGFALSPEKEERWKLCQACEDLRNQRCLHCGCNMRGKIYLGTAYCKLEKW